ncbi:PilZ domain-containing protein [Stenotrophomonas sp. HITSZ_GD]|uniref:PilZ domain-containing protein n=1 Tax=Stenotrophomonas sp. HITSZ_GD TaxID=3037248 RepID=UPI00240DBCDB|nr:PilZ domain-containing protein [Stenotrophomonas sp. HITSZ_GD]MDG2526823.1 PilZ domain-containing protein [Stenotrophomonas sp. HITSZ_GD]
MIHEARRSPRRQPTASITVTDHMAEGSIGRLGNVSESGMLLLASAPLTEDALYQLGFTLPDRQGREHPIDVGVHLLWLEQAHAPGQHWAGFRFLTISDEHRERLRDWVAEAQV